MTKRVSVIVPTRNRVDLLRLLLDAMDRQTYNDFEIVLIDDGSTEDVSSVVARYGTLDIRYIRTEQLGAVTARCAGIAESSGDILAFTDSDCEPEPRWLQEGVDAIDAGADVVQGVTLPARDTRLGERTLSYRGGEGLFATCNMFYTRGAYIAAGGFDQGASNRWRFRVDEHARGLGFGEDSLLGWRVARTGTFHLAEKAIVRHAVTRPPLKELFSRAWQAGAFPALVREIPELRSSLLRKRVFLQTHERVPLYAAAIALALGQLDIAAVAAGWWAGSVADGVSRKWDETVPRRLAMMPLEVALEATKAVALVVGSLRTRTPVL